MRAGKNGFRRITAMVCALALCASLIPTTVFAEVEPTASPAGEVYTTEPAEPQTTENTSNTGDAALKEQPEADTKDDKENQNVDLTVPEEKENAEPVGDDDEKSNDEESTAVNAEADEKENDAEPSAKNDLQPASLMRQAPAAAKVVGGQEKNSDEEIFSVEYYEGLSTDIKSDVTVVAVDENGDVIDRLNLGPIYCASWTMSISLNDAYKTVYELDSVTGDDGVVVLDWTGDFNDAQNTSFTWRDGDQGTGTIYLHIKEASHVLQLKNTEKGVDLGTITWKEGGKQLTTVNVYLNYDLVYTSEPLNISNALNNFKLDLKDGYYFNTVTMEDIQYSSSIDG